MAHNMETHAQTSTTYNPDHEIHTHHLIPSNFQNRANHQSNLFKKVMVSEVN
jgi:hypothetical protein